MSDSRNSSRLADNDDLSAFYKSEDRQPHAIKNVNRRQSVKVQRVQEMVSDSFKPIALANKYVDSLFPETELIDKRDIIANGVGFPILVSYHTVFLTLFLVFFIIGFLKDTTTVYLAPYSATPTDSCNAVPISTTQSFKVDSKGIWEGSSGYDDSKAVYELELIRANLNDEMYNKMMKKFEDEMKRVSTLAESRDLQFYALALSSFNARWTPSKGERKQGGEGVINMYFIGKSNYIFNSDIEDFSFFDKNTSTICTPADTTLEYDLTAGSFVMTIDTSLNGSYNLRTQKIVEPCPDMFELYDSFVLSYSVQNTIRMRPTERVKINAASLTTALAITNGIAPLSSLTKIFDITTNPDTWAGFTPSGRRTQADGARRRRTQADGARRSLASINLMDINDRNARMAAVDAAVESSSSYDDDDNDDYYYYYYYFYADDDRDDDGDDGHNTFPGYKGGFYVDHYYENMDNIFCVAPQDSKPSTYNDTCFLQVGQMLVLPLVLNRGYENLTDTLIYRANGGYEFIYERCRTSECPARSEMAAKYGFDDYYYDSENIRYLKSSILLLSVPIEDAVGDETILDSLVSIASKSYDSLLDAAMPVANSAFNQVAYKEAFPDEFESVLLNGLESGSDPTKGVTLKEYLTNSIDSFIEATGAESLFDMTEPVFLMINEMEKLSNYANLVQGTVLNEDGQLFFHNMSGYTAPLYNEEVFDKIRSTPPVSLVQGYMECTTDPGTAAANNLGVAFANTSTFSAIFFSILISASIYWINMKNYVANKPYVIPKAKKHALNVLALTALLEELVSSTQCNKEVCNEILLALNSTNNYGTDDSVVKTNELGGEGNADKLFLQMRDLNISSKKVSPKN